MSNLDVAPPRPLVGTTSPPIMIEPRPGGSGGPPSHWAAPVRHWQTTAVIAAVAAVVACAAALAYGQKRWQVDGTLVHHPLPIGEEIRGDYSPPTAQTMIHLVKSPTSLETVTREFALPVSATTLDRSLRVTKPYNADAVSITLEWPDPQVGRAVIDRLMELHAQEVAAMRRETVTRRLALLRAEREAARARVAEARSADAARPGVNPERLRTDWEFASKETSALTVDLNVTREALAACRRRIERLAAKEKAVAAGTSGAILEFEPDEAGAPYRKRKEELLDALREEEQRINEIGPQLVTKEQEVAAYKSLRGGAPRVEYERVVGELNLLRVRQRNAEQAVARRKRELAELPAHQLQADREDLVRQRGQLEVKQTVLERTLEEKKREAGRLADAIAAETERAKQGERAEADVRAMDRRITALEYLGRDAVTEFIPARPATASAHPTASNRKSIAALVFGALLSAGLLGLVGHSRATARRCPADVPTYGLPVIAAADGDLPADGRARVAALATTARQLALRLRGPVHQSGGLMLFTAAADTTQIEDVVYQLARYLALWGDSVLVLDARSPSRSDPNPFLRSGDRELPPHAAGDVVALVDPASHPPRGSTGLSHVLQSGEDETAHVRDTPLTGVQYFPVGAVFPDADLLASAGMHRLLVRMSERYDRILILGPSLGQPVAVEILAGYADGAVVALPRCESESADVARAVQAVRNAGVPWVGAVVRS